MSHKPNCACGKPGEWDEDDFLDDFLAGFSRVQFQDDEILRLVKKNGEIVHLRKKRIAK